VSAYIITTNYNYNLYNYTIVQLYGNSYKTIIDDELQIYSDSVLEKTNIEEFIIVKTIQYYKKYICGFYSSVNNIIVISANKTCDIAHNLHRALYLAIDESEFMINNTDKWTLLNEYPYTPNYNYIDLQKGFINNYAMYDVKADKAVHFEELMTINKNKKYDDIILNKFKILIKALILYDFSFFDIIITKSNENKLFKNVIDSIVMLNNNTLNVSKSNRQINDSVIINNNNKQIIVLNSVNYTDDEDTFMNNYKAELACQAEKEKYALLAKKYLCVGNQQLYTFQNSCATKIEPLILTIDNDNAHLYGWLQANQEYNIPSYINTKSKVKRCLYRIRYINFEEQKIILHDNKLLFKAQGTLCDNSCIGGYISGNNSYVIYMMVNIFFKIN